jgi:hypothetical protein
MAIALIGMLAIAVVGSNESMFHGIGDEPLDETLRKAVREARYQSVSLGGRVTLRWDEEARAFVIRDSVGRELKRMKSDAKGAKDVVVFSCIQPTDGYELKDGDPALLEVNELVFDADRSATPFIADLHYAGEDYSVRFDPFSNLRMEAPGSK